MVRLDLAEDFVDPKFSIKSKGTRAIHINNPEK